MFSWIRRTLLFAVGFTLPINAFSIVDVGRFGVTPFKLATAVLLAVAAVHFSVGRRRIGGDSKIVWIVAYGVGFALSLVQGYLRGLPASGLLVVSLTYYSLLLYYVLVGYVITQVDELKTLLWGLVIGGLVTAVPAILGFGQQGMLGRSSGFTSSVNLFGIDMGIIIVVALALFLTSRSLFARALLALAAAAALGGLLRSFSRTAFIAGAAMWGLWVFRSGRADSVKYVIPGVALLVGIVLLAPAGVGERISSITDAKERAESGSIQVRLVQFEFALKAFASSPLVGVGARNFMFWAQKQPGGRVVHHNVHNAYLGTLAEQGLAGFIPFMMLLFLSWKQYGQAWRAARARRALRDPELVLLGTYALFLQIALLGSAVAGLTIIMQESRSLWLLMALAPVVRNLIARRLGILEASSPAPEVGQAEPSPAVALA